MSREKWYTPSRFQARRNSHFNRLQALETNSPGKLARAGWRANSVSPGDRIGVKLHPLKDGGPGGQLVSIVLPDGAPLDVP